MTVVLGYCRLQSRKIRVIGSRYRHPVADRVSADDESAGMDTRATDGALQHLGIFDGIALAGVGGVFCLSQLRRILDGIGKIHLRAVRQSVWNRLAERIRLVERQLLYSGHVLDGVLRCHRTVCNNVGTVLMTVLIHYPAQDLASSIIIKVGIDIRQVDTVRVQETLKQEVVLQRVNLGNAQAIGHHGTSRRTTARTHHHAQLLASRPDEVAHDEEVARETHGLHHVELEVHMLVHVRRQRISIELPGSLVGKMAQILGLKLDAVYLVVAAQTVDHLLSFLRRQLILAVLIAGEFLVKVFL